jgi:hypothetical protein
MRYVTAGDGGNVPCNGARAAAVAAAASLRPRM